MTSGEEAQREALRRVPGREKYEFFFDRFLEYFFGPEDARFIAALGLNLVRIPINYRHFESACRGWSIRRLTPPGWSGCGSRSAPSWLIRRLVRHILLAEPLLEEFAALCAGLDQEELDHLLQSFQFKHCLQREPLKAILNEYAHRFSPRGRQTAQRRRR